MKQSGTCPKCTCTNLWYVPDVAANRETGTMQRHDTFELAVIGNGSSGTAGKLQAVVCQQCGYCELYLKEALVADGVHVIELRKDSPPYRG